MTLLLLDYFGTIVFALSGALVAGRNDMDLFGAFTLATAAAIGGGTVRDLLLDVTPFWMVDVTYIYLIFIICFVAFTLTHWINRIPRKSVDIADAIGLAAFTVIGTVKTFEAGFALPVCVIMGIMTGVAGGAFRDILSNQVPLVLKERGFYATASFFGGLILVLTTPYIGLVYASILGGSVTLLLRLAAIQWRLSLPSFPAIK